MPRIKVKYFGKIRTVTNKISEVINLPGEKVYDLLNLLTQIYGDKFRRIIFRDNKLASDIIILINGKSIGDNLQQKIADGDIISILPFVSGG